MSRTDARDQRIARWLELTREILPAMATSARWPVRHDHCFMRICLDAAFGAPWTSRVAPPAIRTMTWDELGAAFAVAERIVADPPLLLELNARSLQGRRQAKVAA